MKNGSVATALHRHCIGYALAWQLEPAPTPKQLQPLGDRFRPYRSIAARYCWAAIPLLRPGSTGPTRL